VTVATLLKKVEELGARVVTLETENIRVNQENSRLQSENRMLRQKLDLISVITSVASGMKV